MCGIVGYVGKREAGPLLVGGLRSLEYRGYDSAGIATLDGGVRIRRAQGALANLEKKLDASPLVGAVGIAHTRWATHGAPTEANAHPHADCSGTLAVVHNGIIENYAELKEWLCASGHRFRSETDTEVLPHLIEESLKRGRTLPEAVRETVKLVRGTYGLVVISADHPDQLVAARLGSPLVIGLGDGETFIASDANAVIPHTRRVIFLDEGELAILRAGDYQIRSLANLPIYREAERIDWSPEGARKQGHAHFMLKEMLEQPEVLTNSLRGRVHASEGTAVLGGLRDVTDRLRDSKRMVITACGSAFYAGLVGRYMLEEYAALPVEAELASELRYRSPIIGRDTAVLAVSQSGETADTLAALRLARGHGALTLGIVNAVGSTIARETDAGVYNHAGPEIGVASTKAFVSQLTVFALLTLSLGRIRGTLPAEEGRIIAEALERLPEQAASVLTRASEIEALAKRYAWAENYLYLGRKYHAPIAYEGALKIKEVAYVHAEGYAAGEMKHGPLALVYEKFPSVVLVPNDSVYEKTKSNIAEIRARSGPVIAFTTPEHPGLEELCDDLCVIPKTHEMLQPILSAIPLQLFAYYAAVERGYDPDRPRNLAKSVTVE